MTVDISNDPVTLAWRAKYAAMGLPDSLLQAMIDEANAEFNSVIGWGDINRMAILRVNIVDHDTTAGCFFRINVCWGATLFTGYGTETFSHQFPQVPCVTLHIEVFKILNDGTAVHGYGFLLFNHSKDEDCTITVNPVTNQVVAELEAIEGW